MIRVAIIALSLMILTGCKIIEVEHEIGYKGRARVNPWLAAERFSERMQWPTRSVVAWSAPGWQEAAWIMPASVLGNESFVRQTEEWVLNGGHLILLVEHANVETSDWSDDTVEPEIQRALLRMLGRAGIELDENQEAEADQIRFGDTSYEVDAESGCCVAICGGDPGVMASTWFGSGRLTVLTDARLWRNRWIDEHEHAALLGAVLGANARPGEIVFMRGAGTSLWGMLKEYLWPVLVALVVWIALWLWKNLSRFGPVESVEIPAVSRGYDHHLDALGDFSWRMDRGSSLLMPLRSQIIELAQQEALRAGHAAGEWQGFLALRANWSLERVKRAMVELPPRDPADLTSRTSDLQSLFQFLHHTIQP